MGRFCVGYNLYHSSLSLLLLRIASSHKRERVNTYVYSPVPRPPHYVRCACGQLKAWSKTSHEVDAWGGGGKGDKEFCADYITL